MSTQQILPICTSLVWWRRETSACMTKESTGVIFIEVHTSSQSVELNSENPHPEIELLYLQVYSGISDLSPPGNHFGPGNHQLSCGPKSRWRGGTGELCTSRTFILHEGNQQLTVCLHAQNASLSNQNCTVKLHAQQFYEQSWTSQVLEVGLSNYKIIHLIYISKYSK